MATIPLLTRERILAAYDKGEGTREEVAKRYRVSVGLVKKLLQQRREGGDIGPRHHRAGRKPLIDLRQQRRLQMLLEQKPTLTLADLRSRLKLECTVQAIHAALKKMGLSTRPRLTAPVRGKARAR